MKKDVVLGIACGYNERTLRPFLKTLRNNGFKGEIVLFVNRDTPDRIKIEKKYNVDTIAVDIINTFFFNPELQASLEKEFPPRSMSPNVARYFFYLTWIKQHNDQYNNVFIADTRDMIFQENLSSLNHNNMVNFYSEYDWIKIADNSVNEKWTIKAYGQETFEEIRNNTVSCSGFSHGSQPKMIHYLEMMCDEFRKINKRGITLLGGLDQGVHNYLLSHNRIDSNKIHPNISAGVITMNGRGEYTIINGKVVDHNSSPIVVVHQYDRIGKLLRKYNKLEYLRHLNWKIISNKINLFKKN